MATITGYTASRMQAIEDGTIVTASYDSSGHLILTKHDGTQIDVGRTTAATTAQSGIVELATNAETQAGTDTTRAITPAGLASLSGYRVQIVTGIAETATPAAWPYGVSLQSVATGSGWTPNSGVGIVVTTSIDSTHTVQDFYANVGAASPKTWTRSYNGAWSNWAQKILMVNLDPTAFTQATARGNYPVGQSRLYYTAGSASSWDFASIAPGEVITYIADDANFFGRQTFTQHAGGSTNPVQWFRTANQAGGWTAWQPVITDPGAWYTWTPTWSTSSGLHLPAWGNTAPSFKAHKIGRKVEVIYDITFGSTTNFGASAGSTDNWLFSLPAQWPALASSGFVGYGDIYSAANSLGQVRIKLNSTTTVAFGILLAFSGGTISGGIGGDLDSVTPWTWASGNNFRGSFMYETAA
jgi:hypothetical protein